MSLWFQLPSTGLLLDKLKNIFGGSGERENMAMKLFPSCCHFQITSAGTAISYLIIWLSDGHQILIKLSTRKVCYEDPGNKTD